MGRSWELVLPFFFRKFAVVSERLLSQLDGWLDGWAKFFQASEILGFEISRFQGCNFRTALQDET
jgi:hypothetical protein